MKYIYFFKLVCFRFKIIPSLVLNKSFNLISKSNKIPGISFNQVYMIFNKVYLASDP